MRPPRAACSAQAIYCDRHPCVESWWTVRTPDGDEYDFCSACCVLELIVLAGLTADAGESRRDGEAA